MTASRRDLTLATTELCRRLRSTGIGVSIRAGIDAVLSLALVDLRDRREVYLALRCILAQRVEDYKAFDDAFRETFRAPADPSVGPAPSRGEGPPAASRSLAYAGLWAQAGDGTEEMRVPAFGTEEGRGLKDLSLYRADELEEITRAARRMARRLALRRGRRWQSVRRGPRLHARRTFLGMLRTGGDVVELRYRRRKPRRTRLYVLCDVSGSMDVYSRFLMQFLFAMQGAFARVETFVFSTRLERVTDALRTMTFGQALDRLAQVRGFSGGTRIGECLNAFESGWGPRLDRESVVLILSDGWDTGEVDLLARAMQRIQRRAGRLIWLNPLLGSAQYQPLTRGMQAALPYIDVFASAHDLESLRAMTRYLNV